jgi:hypothetical protein
MTKLLKNRKDNYYLYILNIIIVLAGIEVGIVLISILIKLIIFLGERREIMIYNNPPWAPYIAILALVLALIVRYRILKRNKTQ